MGGLTLLLRLLKESFSWSDGSLRRPSLHRLSVVFCLFPMLGIIVAVNWLFLLLDEILFSRYRRQEIPRSVFIVGTPRTATTLLYLTLAKDRENFTAFTMWELLFAPSIIQKYFFLGLGSINRTLGDPAAPLIGVLDWLCFRQLKGIHEMSMRKPEEDEVLFLYIFSSALLFYAFPGTELVDDFLEFDRRITAERRQVIMRFYKRCVQRHNYVFNREGHKIFLSKNPTFVAKLLSLKETFPTSRILYTYRPISQTIPSTIGLNRTIFGVFSSFDEPYPLVEKTAEMMMTWVEMSFMALRGVYKEYGLIIEYEGLTTALLQTLTEIYNWLEIESKKEIQEYWMEREQRGKLFKSKNSYEPNIGVDRLTLSIRLKDVVSPYSI